MSSDAMHMGQDPEEAAYLERREMDKRPESAYQTLIRGLDDEQIDLLQPSGERHST